MLENNRIIDLINDQRTLLFFISELTMILEKERFDPPTIVGIKQRLDELQKDLDNVGI